MLGKNEIADVERRAAAARLTMAELCALAGVHQPSWSRAKTRGTVRPRMIRALEQALESVETGTKADG